MGIFEAIVVFVMSWWLVLLPILSAGTRSQEQAGSVTPGTEPAAPVRPRMVPKIIIATIAASAITLAIWLVLRFGWVDFTAQPG